ncbi:ParB N-terminal domain-containing protein [Bradyrhizobium japonicum]|uniref:ParB N-terminal domain-containing protein n=1 Tax=Bradyrhizobium japonicum TaxID=375 RepID=UPI0009B8F26E
MNAQKWAKTAGDWRTWTLWSIKPPWKCGRSGALRPYERNSRRHSPEQIEQIAAAIREWGWTIPILAADDGMVLAGHGRLATGNCSA